MKIFNNILTLRALISFPINLKSSIKKNILSKISIAFLIAWTFFMNYMFFSLKEDLLIKYEKQINLDKSRLSQIIDSNIESLAAISKNISRVTFSDNYIVKNYNEITLPEKLDISWHIFKYQKKFLSLKYYGRDSQLIRIWGESSNNLMDDERLKKSFESRTGYASISCNKSCYINISHTLHPSSFREGIIEVSIPLFNTLNKFKSLSKPNIAVLKVLKNISTDKNQALSLLNDSYKNMAATSLIEFEEIKKEILNVEEKNKTYIIHKNNNSHLLHAGSLEKYPGIIFLFHENISEFFNEQKATFLKITKFSFYIALFILLILYFSLNNIISRLQKIIKILPIIGSGNFNLAENKISKLNFIHENDELDLLYFSTKNLNTKLKNLHENLSLQNIKLQKIADYDAMTGVFNRRKFMKELKKLHRKNKEFHLINIDLDHFKIINDTLGHAQGDKLLIEISKILLSSISSNDIIGRVGGDEFNIILKTKNIENVKKTLDDISLKSKKVKLSKISVFYSKLTLSIGVSYFPGKNMTIDDLTSFADIAMYENKRYKENFYHFYTGNELILLEEKKLINTTNLLSNAIENDLIKPFYQKILSADNEIYSYEALIRIWSEEEQSYYEPGFFIDQAEKSHVIIQIDRIMIKKILAEASTMTPQPRLMVNFSNITMASSNITEYLMNIVNSHHYDPRLITIELTETTEIKKLNEIELLIKKLKKIGFKFALDDFGSGYSSFYYISRLPIDYIKIDKSIINSLLIDSDDFINFNIFKAILSIANQSDIKIIAEGIESVELLNIVNQFDVDLLQGYLFDKPSPNLSTESQRNPVKISTAKSSTS